MRGGRGRAQLPPSAPGARAAARHGALGRHCGLVPAAVGCLLAATSAFSAPARRDVSRAASFHVPAWGRETRGHSL